MKQLYILVLFVLESIFRYFVHFCLLLLQILVPGVHLEVELIYLYPTVLFYGKVVSLGYTNNIWVKRKR